MCQMMTRMSCYWHRGETARAARRASNILQHDRVILAAKHQKRDVLAQVFQGLAG